MITPAEGDTSQLLAELRELLVGWRRLRGGDSAAPGKQGKRAAVAEKLAAGGALVAGDGFASRFEALDAELSAGGHLPTAWAQAAAEPAPLPDSAPPPLQAAAAEVEAALAAYRAAEAAKTSATAGLDDAGKALGDARQRFLELARRADLERP